MNLVPEGIHTVRARTWTFKPRPSGGFYLWIRLVVEDNDTGCKGDTVLCSLFFGDGTVEERISLRAMRDLGWRGDDPSECHDCGGGLDRFPVRAIVIHKQYRENTIAVVERFLSEDAETRAKVQEYFRRLSLPSVPPRAMDSSIESDDNNP